MAVGFFRTTQPQTLTTRRRSMCRVTWWSLSTPSLWRGTSYVAIYRTSGGANVRSVRAVGGACPALP